MRISVLVTAYRRPEQLREALASLAQQEQSLMGEILVGDDSPPECWPENQAVIAASGLTSLIEYLPSNPPRGTYGNQCFLGKRARFDHILILHDDDQLCPDALATLAAACENETEDDVKVWFGRILVMDEHGQVDMARSVANDEFYGRGGASEVRPMWDWGLYEALPPNSFLISRETYTRFAYGPRDGNVGDWGLVVRLANGGAKGRFIARYLSRYRVQSASVTNAGRGVDVHRWYELLEQLRVPPEGQARKAERLERHAMVAITRYARDGDRSSAWRCFFSPHVSWQQRLSRRGWATMGMLLTPAKWWTWALRYRS